MNIFSHNGIITIKNPKTGNHRTFRIKTQKDNDQFAPGERIVQLLTGPDNENDYRGFGFVKNDHIVLWKKYVGIDNGSFEKFCKILTNPDKFGLEVNFEGKCRRCNRTLSTPLSVSLGIGPECVKNERSF